MKKLYLCFAAGLLLSACGVKQTSSGEPTPNISKEMIKKVSESLESRYGAQERIQRGVAHAASLWTSEDGTPDEFKTFCETNFAGDDHSRKILFDKLSRNFEAIFGYNHLVDATLREPVDLDSGELSPVDYLFGAYNVGAHFNSDMFANKAAFIVALNFPAYNLDEKNQRGENWTRLEWAYARMGDLFTSRVPASIEQRIGQSMADADAYISDYNIFMGKLLNKEEKTMFPENMKLITHWGLRDELKSNYADKQNGLEKQQMVYEVMKRIISQEIPQVVINNEILQWNPFTNTVYEQGKEIKTTPEPDTRYQHLLNNFLARSAADPYCSTAPSAIQRSFDHGMELTKNDVEKMFTDFVASPQAKEVGMLIASRLGRNLEPFDIWYDGFKSRSSISEDMLTRKIQALYPNRDAFQKGLPEILVKLGFPQAEAERITSHVQVDASRGAGHAMGAEMKGDKAHLRTRIGANGMDYKGYNIAIHEFGHNVEQTISLYDVDYYMLNGVPNTAFTEALAFIFQSRDLELLGISQNDPNQEPLKALDNFWSAYEIMGVSLVDIKVWEWMYANPTCTAAQLKENVIRIAKEVWNAYYAPVFGMKDEPILAVYSHMIDYPMYLPNYPVGQIINFQIEEKLKGANFAEEVERIFRLGTITPQQWIKQAVGKEISTEALLHATSEAVKALK